jgi:peroxiredoxin
LEKLIEDHRQANTPFVDSLRTAKSADEKEVIRAAQSKLAKEYSDKFYAIAEKSPKSPVAGQALAWILKYDVSSPTTAKAMDMLVKYFLNAAALTPILSGLKPEVAGVERLLKPAAEKSKYAENQAAALLVWAEILQARAELADKKEDSARMLKEAEQKVTDLINKFALVDRGSYVRKARDIQYELQNLSVGKTAPDISGNDLDEQPFKLKDYRGKVVVLLFWNSKHPKHGQSLSEMAQILGKHMGKPLVVIGVSSENAKFAKDYVEASKITWRSWHDDGRRIGRDWRSDGNTLYVIDAKGVIRGRNVHEQKLFGLVEELVKE